MLKSNSRRLLAGFPDKGRSHCSGIAEPGGHLGRIRANGLHNFASVRDNQIGGSCDIVHHDIEQKTRRRSWRPADNPGAAYFTGRIVERKRSIARRRLRQPKTFS